MKTRFAPSPTGYLHIGHAWSAWHGQRLARELNGEFTLRIEDIDQTRCRPEFETAIFEDLSWLGFDWPTPVRRQSDHFDDYRAALLQLDAMGLLYKCFCSRADIKAENAPHGPEGPIYPATCKNLCASETAERVERGDAYALRLDMDKAIRQAGTKLYWHDIYKGDQLARPDLFGDIVLARKDTPASYHLCVTHDDALEGMTHIVRGEDLFEATHIHRLLQALLNYPTPLYAHHGLLLNSEGKRFAKRDGAVTLREIRAKGVSAEALLTALIKGDHAAVTE